MGRSGVLSRFHASHEADRDSISQTADSISEGSTILQGAYPACMQMYIGQPCYSADHSHGLGTSPVLLYGL